MKNDLFYLWQDGQRKGPFTLEQLRSMWKSGFVTVKTLYWKEGMGQWVPLENIHTLLEGTISAVPIVAPITNVEPALVPAQNLFFFLDLSFKLVGCLFFLWILWSCHRFNERCEDAAFFRESPSQNTSNDVAAFTVAELYVKQQLKSPSTAKFCSPSDATITEGHGRTIVTGWVDAENAFGAHPRAYWCCALTGDSGHYVVSEFVWK